MTQVELDELCVQTQMAITILSRDFLVMQQRGDIFIKRRCAQVMVLNCLMQSIQDYNYDDWDFLSEEQLQDIVEKIAYLQEWRD